MVNEMRAELVKEFIVKCKIIGAYQCERSLVDR